MVLKLLAASAISGSILVAPQASTQSVELKVLAAVGMRQVMLELGPRFEKATGHTLAVTFLGTGTIVKRVADGEEVDVVMINHAFFDSLAKEGRVVPGSITPVASAIVGVAVRKGAVKPDISTPEAFKRLLLSAKSVARPPGTGASSGSHIAEVLQRLDVFDEVNSKSVIGGDQPGQMGSPGGAVASGKAEIALHQLQELIRIPGIDIVGPFPRELQGSFVFSVGISTNARSIHAGKALIAFLGARDALRAMKELGMEPIVP